MTILGQPTDDHRGSRPPGIMNGSTWIGCEAEMRQTLFYIPHEMWGRPLFGWEGWLTWLWMLTLLVVLVYGIVRKRGLDQELMHNMLVFAAIACLLGFIVPMLESETPDGIKLGIPIRGYGVFMLLGFVCGLGLAVYQASRVGLDTERIYSLAFWLFVGGIGGARLFYVLQYWDEFSDDLTKVFRFTEGGLVVYGSLIGALAALALFARTKNIPLLALSDLIAPSMAIGLALGRLGCLMNGCCYGGPCELPIGVSFPAGSPPYQRQLAEGQLLGLEISGEGEGQRIQAVRQGSLAQRAGLEPGERILAMDLNRDPLRVITEHHQLQVARENLPPSSLPVHPTQVYSSLSAFLLFLVLWFYYPLRRADGQVTALMLSLYPLIRFLLEWIRTDEAGQFGTSLTISQWVSLALVASAIGLWWASRRFGDLRFPVAQPERSASV